MNILVRGWWSGLTINQLVSYSETFQVICLRRWLIVACDMPSEVKCLRGWFHGVWWKLGSGFGFKSAKQINNFYNARKYLWNLRKQHAKQDNWRHPLNRLQKVWLGGRHLPYCRIDRLTWSLYVNRTTQTWMSQGNLYQSVTVLASSLNSVVFFVVRGSLWNNSPFYAVGQSCPSVRFTYCHVGHMPLMDQIVRQKSWFRCVHCEGVGCLEPVVFSPRS